MKFPGTIYVKITYDNPKQPPWVCTSLNVKHNPERTVKHLNKLAADQGLGAHYALATKEEYWAYRAQINKGYQNA